MIQHKHNRAIAGRIIVQPTKPAQTFSTQMQSPSLWRIIWCSSASVIRSCAPNCARCRALLTSRTGCLGCSECCCRGFGAMLAHVKGGDGEAFFGWR